MNKKIISVIAISLAFLMSMPLFSKRGHKRHHKGPKHMMKKIDKNRDGKIDKNEWNAHFKEMDVNKDGVLSKADFDAMRKKHKDMDEDEDD